MTITDTRQHLIDYLKNGEVKVIALSGSWGVGKTHLWTQVQAEPEMKGTPVAEALKTSLFGMSSIDHVKSKLVQGASPGDSSALDKGWRVFSSLTDFLGKHNKAFAAINDLTLLAAPQVLKNRFIVLDDIERRRDSLSIQEILGFIDEFSLMHGVRFLLILNNEKLDRRADWDLLREKIIDHEIRLDTTPTEALAIALSDRPLPYAREIEHAVECCGVTNIRILKRMIAITARVLPNDAPPEVVARVVPSVVLLAAIHFKGMADGPDFNFLLNGGDAVTSRSLSDQASESSNGQDDEKRKAKEEQWRSLLANLRIFSVEELEYLLIDFLQSGILDVAKVQEVMERHSRQVDVLTRRASVNDFIVSVYWDFHASDSDLLTRAESLVEHCHLIGASLMTTLYQAVEELPGGKPIAERMLNAWLEALRGDSNAVRSMMEYPSGTPVLPQILLAFDEMGRVDYSRTLLKEALAIVRKGSWGHQEEAVLRAATIADLEAVIQECTSEEFPHFATHMLKLHAQRSEYEKHFGSVMDNFMLACRNLVETGENKRLAQILSRLIRH